MATVTVAKHPELDVDRAMELFQRQFAGKYQIQRMKAGLGLRDFVVKKSGWTGVGVKMKQEKDSTSFVFTGTMPSWIYRALFGGLLEYLVLRSRWRAMESEIADFIRSAPEFK